MSGVVYLLHFSSPIAPGRHTAQHYLGYAEDLDARLKAHRTGAGARLVQVATQRGLSFVVVRVWVGDRKLERRLKRRHASPRLCPLCNGRWPVQLPLLSGVCAFIPQPQEEEEEEEETT